MATAPFVANPATYKKADAVVAAVVYVEKFLDHNSLPRVKRYLWEPNDELKPPGSNRWHANGWYWNGNLFVNVKKSRVPVKTPGFQWSFTGFKADLTAPGILAHETGHHAHFSKFDTRELLGALRKVASEEAQVSSYEPNVYEVFAEAMRLFILNPNLLREGRPKRFKLITDLGLRPLHDVDWHKVLEHAHPKLIAAAENWIKRG